MSLILRKSSDILRHNIIKSELLIKNISQSQCTKALSFYTNPKYSLLLSHNEASRLNSPINQSVIPFSQTGTWKIPKNLSSHRFASSSSNHVPIWQVERIVSVVLPIILPACILLENPLLDSMVAVLTVIHTHWGLEAIVVDYARPIVVGTVVPKILHLLLNILSITTLAGLLLLVYKGPGIAKTVKNIWSIDKNNEK